MADVFGGILVTGAGGFIGGHAVQRLVRDGHRVTSATRDGRGGSVALDLRQPDTIARALQGIDAVVHCAVGGRAVTVNGTRALLQAAATAGVKRVVHLSSVAVYGAATGDLAEQTPLVPPGHSYAGMKAEAEALCIAQTGLQVVRLRPSIVYGPGSKLWVADLARRIRSGRWGTLGPAGAGICNLVHVADVASAIAAALVHPGVAGMAFNVNGPEAVTWNDWFTMLANGMGAPALPALPPRTVRWRSAAALPVKAVARVIPGFAAEWRLGAPAASELALFALRAHYPVDAAERAMGWRPAIRLADGLASSVQWLRQEGLA